MNKKTRGIVILGFLLLVFSSYNAVQAQTDAVTLELFRAVSLAHGGNNLENLKTLMIKSKDSLDFEDTSLFDLTNKKYRRERKKKQ